MSNHFPTKKLKIHAKQNLVYLWEICQRMDISESTLTRLLRHESIPEEKAKEIMAVIDQIAMEKGINDAE